MKYQLGDEVKDTTGGKYYIDNIISKQTPVGYTLFFELKSNNKSLPNQRVTEWALNTYFEVID